MTSIACGGTNRSTLLGNILGFVVARLVNGYGALEAVQLRNGLHKEMGYFGQ